MTSQAPADSVFSLIEGLSHPLAVLIAIVVPLVAGIAKHGYDRAKANQMEAELNKNSQRLDELKSDHNQFRLEVAQRYATNETVQKIEERVVQALERLTERLDRVLLHQASGDRGA